MISLSTKITATLPNKRVINRVKNSCNRLAALEVRQQFRDHFEPNAQQRFKYKRRSRKYTEKKQRLFGHTTPLVFSGDLRRAVLSSARVTATSKKGSVIARGSRSSNLRQQYRDEIETITKKQDREISKNWGNNFAELAERPEFQSTTTTKTGR